MKRIWSLVYLWTAVFTQTGVFADVSFLERQEGESVRLPCEMSPRGSSPFGLYLRRSWLRSGQVFFFYTKEKPNVSDVAYKGRLSVAGDPSDGAVNVSISGLSAADTDRYFCEFVVEKVASEDEKIRGKTEFFLLVKSDGPVDIEVVPTCSGGSAVLPCHAPTGDGLAVEGVSLKRQRGRAPVEVVYHSKEQRGSGSHFPAERVQLTSLPSPHGISYNMTLQQLQPEDSALYSCQLLLRGTPDHITRLGGRAYFVSVQGDACGDSSHSVLLYGLFAAVAVVLLLVVGLVVTCKGRGRRGAQPQPPPPIYEEMVGVQSPSQKLAPLRLEDVESSEYKNCPARKPPTNNHYESPRGALFPRTESEK